jgi:hypothetical protein
MGSCNLVFLNDCSSVHIYMYIHISICIGLCMQNILSKKWKAFGLRVALVCERCRLAGGVRVVCEWFFKARLDLRVVFASGFAHVCEWFLRVVFASGFCEWFLRVVLHMFASGFANLCEWFLRVVVFSRHIDFASGFANFASGQMFFASGFCEWSVAFASGFCEWSSRSRPCSWVDPPRWPLGAGSTQVDPAKPNST